MSAKRPSSYHAIPFTKEENELFKKHHNINVDRLLHVGEKGYTLPEHFMNQVDWLRNFTLRRDDVFVVSFPRSGSTWTRELVWLLANDLDFEKAKAIVIEERFKYLECNIWMPPQTNDRACDWQGDLEAAISQCIARLETTREQRFIFSHLPLTLLPAGLLDTCKVIYVARDMRDVAVSCYHYFKVLKLMGLVTDNFKTYYEEVFSENLAYFSPYFEHVKEGWELRNHCNMLFLSYEELSKDLKNEVRRVADFLGKTYTNQQLDQLCEHLKFDNFQKNPAVDSPGGRRMGVLEEGKNHIRKGKVGGWRDYFDEEMTRHAESWIKQELDGTGLNFQ